MIKQWKLTAAVLATLTLTVAVRSQSISFDEAKCKDVAKVAEELIERELAGRRWQGGKSKCIDQKRFERVKAVQESAGDASTLDPTVLIPKGKEITIDPPSVNAVTEIYTVKFFYVGKNIKTGKPDNIRDSLQFSIHSKGAIKTEGCGMLIEPPETFSMREECHYD